MSQEEKNKERPWLAVTEDKMVRCISWQEFVNDFSIANDNGQYPIERLIGLMHWGSRIELTTPREEMERIIFYLHFADNRNEFATQCPNSLYTVLKRCAYKELLEKLLDFIKINNFWVYAIYDDEDGNDIDTFVEMIKQIVVFFHNHLNAPQEDEPEYKKEIALCLARIKEILNSDQIKIVIAKSEIIGIDFDKDNVIAINKLITKALVACRLYQTIVGEKMFDAMDYLAKVADKEDHQFRTQRPRIETEQDRRTLRMLCDINLMATYKITNAQGAWLRLWALKTLEELK